MFVCHMCFAILILLVVHILCLLMSIFYATPYFSSGYYVPPVIPLIAPTLLPTLTTGIEMTTGIVLSIMANEGNITPKPLQVYVIHSKLVVLISDFTAGSKESSNPPHLDIDVPIALHKGKESGTALV